MAKQASYDNGKLLELARYLLPDDPSFAEQVRLAVDRPDAYLEQYAEQLGNRGIDEVIPHLPWIALVDGLDARDAMREIDWKSDIEDVLWNLDQLAALRPMRPDRWDELQDEDGDERLPEETLPLIGQRLLGEGLALATIDIDSDSYVMIVLPASKLKEAEQLAELAGYGSITQWS
jgi:hypothetical protein